MGACGLMGRCTTMHPCTAANSTQIELLELLELPHRDQRCLPACIHLQVTDSLKRGFQAMVFVHRWVRRCVCVFGLLVLNRPLVCCPLAGAPLPLSSCRRRPSLSDCSCDPASLSPASPSPSRKDTGKTARTLMLKAQQAGETNLFDCALEEVGAALGETVVQLVFCARGTA